jgi:hypothetical protein
VSRPDFAVVSSQTQNIMRAKTVTGSKGSGESFEARRGPTRVRLSPDETGPLRYVLGGLSIEDASEWRSAQHWEPSSGSSAMLERAAALEMTKNGTDMPEDKPKGSLIHVHSVCKGGTYDASFDWAAESFSNDRTARGVRHRDRIMRAWRVIKSMARTPSVAILQALYGDRPPGLPPSGLWPAAVDEEYRRVVKFVDGSGGTALALERLLHVDEHHREGERDADRKARQRTAQEARQAVLTELGRGCEALIERATKEYREAWRAGE